MDFVAWKIFYKLLIEGSGKDRETLLNVILPDTNLSRRPSLSVNCSRIATSGFIYQSNKQSSAEVADLVSDKPLDNDFPIINEICFFFRRHWSFSSLFRCFRSLRLSKMSRDCGISFWFLSLISASADWRNAESRLEDDCNCADLVVMIESFCIRMHRLTDALVAIYIDRQLENEVVAFSRNTSIPSPVRTSFTEELH